MKILIAYYIIGVLVSIYFIYHYRLSTKTKKEPKKNDGLLAIIGPSVWPFQIIMRILRK